MYAVIFEVEPEPDRVQEYLDIAARLRAELEKIVRVPVESDQGFRWKMIAQSGGT